MYGRDFEFESNQSPTSDQTNNLIHNSAGYTNPLGLPTNVYLSGFFQFGTPQFLERAAYPDERRWQLADTVEWIHAAPMISSSAKTTFTPTICSRICTTSTVATATVAPRCSATTSLIFISRLTQRCRRLSAKYYSYFNQGSFSYPLLDYK